MPKAPLPRILPGEFFLLRWQRDIETFIVELDDESHNSYDLGPEPLVVVDQLRMRGFEKQFREQAVDIAREFGAAQCIPAQQRVLPIIPRSAPAPDVFAEEGQHDGWVNPSL